MRAGDWEAALALFQERRALTQTNAGEQPSGGARPLSVDAYCYGTAISACAMGKQWEVALELLEDMEAEGDALEGDASFAWNNALVACNRASEWTRALEVYERMRVTPTVTESEHSVAGALGACRGLNDWQRAQAIFDGSKHRTVMCFNALLAALIACGEDVRALAYFDQLKAGKAGCRPDAQSYELAIDACSRHDTDRALLLWVEQQASVL